MIIREFIYLGVLVRFVLFVLAWLQVVGFLFCGGESMRAYHGMEWDG